MLRGALFGFLALGASACASEEPPPIPQGDYYQYVVGEIAIPINNTEARQYALDLNRDKTPDNQFGMIFAVLQQQGFGVGSTVRESLLRGNAIMLAELQTEAFDEAPASGLRTDLGTNPVPAACTDPADFMTCGKHLATRAHFDVVPQTASNLGVGPFDEGQLIAPVGTLPIAIGIDPAAPLRVDLHAAQLRVTDASPTGATVVIGGGILAADIDSVILPEITRNLARIVHDECGVQSAPAPCGCVDGQRAELLQDIFDTDNDCMIESLEVSKNTIIQALFQPDITVDGRKLLSFGIGAKLVPASYTR